MRTRKGGLRENEELRQAVVIGASEREVAVRFPRAYARYRTGIRRFIELVNSSHQRDWRTEFVLYYGTPGSGKSFAAAADGEAWARSLSGNANKKKDQLVFSLNCRDGKDLWDGYSGQPVVIADNDSHSAIGWQTLLRMGDSSPFRVCAKGTTRQFLARRVYFTSRQRFETWFNFAENPNMDKRSLDWRFVKIECFTGKFEEGTAERWVERAV